MNFNSSGSLFPTKIPRKVAVIDPIREMIMAFTRLSEKIGVGLLTDKPAFNELATRVKIDAPLPTPKSGHAHQADIPCSPSGRFPRENGHNNLPALPFGRKTEGGASAYSRQDFWTETSNKQLNFVQHIFTMLEVGGRAAAVVPDNVLFEGGAGQKVRENLLKKCDVHTLLRLPTGIFYAQGVKANVLFFDKRAGSATVQTKELWIYDLRTNKNFTMRTNPLRAEDLEDFITAYHPENRHEREKSERFQPYSYDKLLERDKLSLDIFWLRDESQESADQIQSLEELTLKIIDDLEDALDQFNAIAKDLGIATNGTPTP